MSKSNPDPARIPKGAKRVDEEPTKEAMLLSEIGLTMKHLRIALTLMSDRKDFRAFVPEGQLIESQLSLWIAAVTNEFANPAAAG